MFIDWNTNKCAQLSGGLLGLKQEKAYFLKVRLCRSSSCLEFQLSKGTTELQLLLAQEILEFWNFCEIFWIQVQKHLKDLRKYLWLQVSKALRQALNFQHVFKYLADLGLLTPAKGKQKKRKEKPKQKVLVCKEISRQAEVIQESVLESKTTQRKKKKLVTCFKIKHWRKLSGGGERLPEQMEHFNVA